MRGDALARGDLARGDLARGNWFACWEPASRGDRRGERALFIGLKLLVAG